MSRPQRCRRVCAEPRFRRFAPEGCRSRDVICMSTDEYEVLRLVDYERKTHEECARQMDISRTTVTEIYDSARRKLADVLVNGCRLEISGGNYRICGGAADRCCDTVCRRDPEKLSAQVSDNVVLKKEKDTLRIVLPWNEGDIFPHFGHTELFRVIDVRDGRAVLKSLAENVSGGKGAVIGLLKSMQTDVLICSGIGKAAVEFLKDAGIQVFSGVSGDADRAAELYLKGELEYNSSLTCAGRDKS